MANQLADATSPYLLQHKDNPVDWHEWGSEAFAEATRRDVPVLLSIGYSACHWCHVMAHESFEDDDTAAYMNEHFVSVKVDREERPDVDRIYMDAVTSMTGRGGWPMTVFLMPDQRPIFAGTYFPKERMSQHPSFMDVMGAVLDAWTTNRPAVHEQANNIMTAISNGGPPPGATPTALEVRQAVSTIEQVYDVHHGGFGGAPKFPQAPTLEFLLRMAALEPDTDEGSTALRMLTGTLEHMARGGIYDHLFGGFARYSVDAIWLVPHFEKMLYDNALLARIYLRAWQLTGDDRFRSTAVEVLDYLDGEMADPIGGLHSAEDADSEGEEGKFAVWTWSELQHLLGTDLGLAASIYGFTESGNFEGSNIPTRESSLEAAADAHDLTTDELEVRRKRIDGVLVAARRQRTAPGRDDKLVTAWNGFALRAFAEAAAVLSDDRYLRRAEAIAAYLAGPGSPDGSLVRSWRGRPGVSAFADDLASAAIGWYALFQVTGEAQWFAAAEDAVSELRADFGDPDGGFFATSSSAESLISRPKNIQDNPTPSDNALAMEALQLHAALTGDLTAIEELEATMRSISVVARRHPAFGGHALAVWATHLAGVKEVAITGIAGSTHDMERVVWDVFRPDIVMALNHGTTSTVPLLADRPASELARAFVCQQLTCGLPADSTDDLRAQLTN